MYRFYSKTNGGAGCSFPGRVIEPGGPPPGLPDLFNEWRKSMFHPRILILLFLLIAGFTVNAQTVTISVKKATLPEVFREIKKQTGYDFVYTSEVLKSGHRVSINASKKSLAEVLDQCFKGQPFSYKIVAKTIIITGKNDPLITQGPNSEAQELVHGHVYDERNQPLAGATLRIIDGRVSAVSDERGNYVIMEIPANARLTVSYVGYKSDTVDIAGRNEVNFTLKLAATEMKEVVVSTGYQTLSKERATGSFAKPDMQIFNDRAGSTDVLTRLDGLVPGLTVLTGTGSMASINRGSQPVQQVLIRGTSSVSITSQPLYVVNGVQVPDLTNINTNDIADITVLKDASAAAIWGARATNGVIVVTTKSGRRNQKVKIAYSGYLNYQGKPDFNYQPWLNSAQYIEVAKSTFNPTLYPYRSLGTSFIAPHEQLLYDQSRGLISAAQANAGLDSLSRINNTDQLRKFGYSNAYTNNHTISASGGSAGYDFYTSFSFADTHSKEVGSTNKTYQLTLNQNFNAAKILKVSLITSIGNNLASAKRPMSVLSSILPYQLFQDANGNNLNMDYVQGLSPETRADYQARSGINLGYNPLNEINSGFTKTNAINANVTGTFTLNIWKGLSFVGTYGYQRSPATTESYDDISEYSMRKQLLSFTVAPTVGSTPVYYLPNTGGKYQDTHTDTRNWTVRNQLVYSTTLRSGQDRMNVQIGQEAQDVLVTNRTNSVLGYDLNLQTYPLLDYARLSNGVFGTVSSGRSVYTEAPFTSIETESRFKSYFGLFNYTLNNRYALDASIRKDQSNLFGSSKSGQKKPAYSIGGKWLMGQEAFIKQLTWLNDLGLRATYGVTGNSPYIGAAALQDILFADDINANTGAGYSIANPANIGLSWESTHTVNIGVDFAILNNRISGSIDVYNKHTTDLLGNQPVNPLVGITSTTGNIGSLTNKGIEVSLRAIALNFTDFKWSVGATFAYNRNKVDSYADLLPFQLTDTYRIQSPTGAPLPGYGLNPLFAYRFAGLDNLGDPQIKLADGKIVKTYGAASAKDLVYMGSQIPKFNGGISNSFEYKGFTLSTNLIYNLGAVMRRDVNQFYTGRLTNGGFYSNITTAFLDRWQKPGDEAVTNIPSYVADPFTDFTRRYTAYYTMADINVVSASYIKLRDVTLAYNLPAKTIQSLKISSARIYLQTGNFMIWKANKYNIDPEYQDFRSGGRGLPPYKHNFAIGINASF
ncbi:SusC/RagA family TonB-linked outer membrane protein [Mucilaginibacter rubeus]|uniref:SusC/RagA family TonB-linked outer membrane protein n=1 Tax=Mucilaginibacter rubeus TaxID=2027860 RepID=A0A5C1I0P0_9SPHI|nr:SusC/RagA family TonB-linked outer membrane protein [Mucilaginibacter rubeus]QEM11742.1 SusC/RagA family TonB-linked outer membrane protein [Mucilaginibacter rubeus]